MRKREQKHEVSRKLDIHKVIARENTNGSASGYCSQESTSSYLVVRLPILLIGLKNGYTCIRNRKRKAEKTLQW